MSKSFGERIAAMIDEHFEQEIAEIENQYDDNSAAIWGELHDLRHFLDEIGIEYPDHVMRYQRRMIRLAVEFILQHDRLPSEVAS